MLPTSGSAASTTTTTTAPENIGSTLNVAVTGTDVGKAGPALDLQSTTQGVVANLATDQMATPLSILPSANSITLGWTQEDWSSQLDIPTEAGYRGPLWQSFASNGMLVT